MTSAAHSPGPRVPVWIVAVAVLFGLLCGAFEITNTSIGWHIASGRWMLAHGEVLDHDVFSFTAGGVEWVNHEWLFQILVAALHDLGGPQLLVLLRMLIVAALTVMLLRIGTASGLDPPVALLLAALCVWAARPRFFLRPELFTLLLAPAAMWLFATRDARRWWPAPVAAVIALGVNLHGAMLVVPILLGVWFAGELVGWLLSRDLDRRSLVTGAVGVAGALLAPIANPHGWQLYLVPFRLAELVRQPHIPNPEWISPGPREAPALYVAMVLVAVVLAWKSRAPQSWLTVLATAALALRHVRNTGLFFVLLPQSVAPALARWPVLGARAKRSVVVVSLAIVGALSVAVLVRPWPEAGLGFADRHYPDRAYAFLTEHGLIDGNLYNDVRFGGWLCLHAFPEHRIFIDDRNEIHEPLLREIWQILSSSDVRAWDRLLERWEVDTVLLRYHPPVRVMAPDGTPSAHRGFSSLWFQEKTWAMVYWDDVAMVLVRRAVAPPELLREREVRLLRPDDLEHVAARLASEPELLPLARAELARVLADDPGCRRALEVERFLDSL
jgi:hypothetical protein